MSRFRIQGQCLLVAAGLGILLSACSSAGSTRYGGGPCQFDCYPAPMPMPQPVYYTPPQPKPLPAPQTVTLTPPPTPEPITCSAGWMMGPNGVCLEIVTPTYVPPPSTGYPDHPGHKPPVYKPIRK